MDKMILIRFDIYSPMTHNIAYTETDNSTLCFSFIIKKIQEGIQFDSKKARKKKNIESFSINFQLDSMSQIRKLSRTRLIWRHHDCRSDFKSADIKWRTAVRCEWRVITNEFLSSRSGGRTVTSMNVLGRAQTSFDTVSTRSVVQFFNWITYCGSCKKKKKFV